MSKTGSIYALIDPRNNAVRYVGQTIVPLEKRLSDHLSGPTNGKMRAWFKELREMGLRPLIQLLETVDRKVLDRREAAWLHEMFMRGERPFQLASAGTLWAIHCQGVNPR